MQLVSVSLFVLHTESKRKFCLASGMAVIQPWPYWQRWPWREVLFGISTTASIDYKHIIIQTTYSEIILWTSKTGIVFLLFPSLMSHTLMILHYTHICTHYNTHISESCIKFWRDKIMVNDLPWWIVVLVCRHVSEEYLVMYIYYTW